MQDHDAIYAAAAKAAETEIPEIEEKLRDLQQETEKIQLRLSQLRTIQALAYAQQGYKGSPPAQGNLIPNVQPAQPQRGQALDRIRGVLAKGQPLRAAKIKIEIAKDFGINYGLSTIYAHLSRGKEAGIFKQAGNEEWALASQE